MLCEGQLELQTTDGEAAEFSPGDLLLLDDLSGRGHISRGRGPQPGSGSVRATPPKSEQLLIIVAVRRRRDRLRQRPLA